MSNAMEIERKFLVDPVLWKAAVEREHYRFKSDVIQAHVKQDEPGVQTLRVSIVNAKKAKVSFKGKRTGASRKEIEFKIDLKDAYDLHSMIEHKCHKHRYIAMHDGNEWEVDVMQGENEGLIIAELEMPSEDYKFKKPEWVAQEVTDDPRFYQSYLAFHPYKDWIDKPEIIHEKKEEKTSVPEKINDPNLEKLLAVLRSDSTSSDDIINAVNAFKKALNDTKEGEKEEKKEETYTPKVTEEKKEGVVEDITDQVIANLEKDNTLTAIKKVVEEGAPKIEYDFDKMRESSRSLKPVIKSDYVRLYALFGRVIESRGLPYHISCASTYEYIKHTAYNKALPERIGDPNPPMLFINSDYCDVLGEGWFTDIFGSVDSEYKLNLLCGVSDAIVKPGTKVPVVASKYIPKGFTYSAENREKGSELIMKYLYPNAEKRPEEIIQELVALEAAIPKNL